eukprot:Amastigsp_a676753_229.p4 type:complete len:110 gc:universal Amastigsp_a676753_229:396-67(-)
MSSRPRRRSRRSPSASPSSATTLTSRARATCPLSSTPPSRLSSLRTLSTRRRSSQASPWFLSPPSAVSCTLAARARRSAPPASPSSRSSSALARVPSRRTTSCTWPTLG